MMSSLLVPDRKLWSIPAFPFRNCLPKPSHPPPHPPTQSALILVWMHSSRIETDNIALKQFQTVRFDFGVFFFLPSRLLWFLFYYFCLFFLIFYSCGDYFIFEPVSVRKLYTTCNVYPLKCFKWHTHTKKKEEEENLCMFQWLYLPRSHKQNKWNKLPKICTPLFHRFIVYYLA